MPETNLNRTEDIPVLFNIQQDWPCQALPPELKTGWFGPGI
jgi:hypothetical protein